MSGFSSFFHIVQVIESFFWRLQIDGIVPCFIAISDAISI